MVHRQQMKLLHLASCLILCLGSGANMAANAETGGPFVSVRDGRFYLDGKPYFYAGTNFWYGAYLGSPGETGDRERLIRELDLLEHHGISNLRILAASANSRLVRSLHPAIQTGPGRYDGDLLEGLDFLLVEMARREMKAVLFLTNFWQWSGGMSQYVAWATGRKVTDPDVTGDWERFITTSAEFYTLAEAQKLYRAFIETLVNRKNSINGVRYRSDPTIMAWQLANEPRPGAQGQDAALNDAFVDWVEKSARYLRELDGNHLISSGSEGSWGTLHDDGLYMRTHDTPYIDYLTVHLWIKNWSWFDIGNPEATYPDAAAKSRRYLSRHIEMARSLNKPLVLEEFGVERDAGDYGVQSTTVYRDRFFDEVYDLVYRSAARGEPIMGTNFWSWGGSGRAAGTDLIWRPGDDFVGDPPQEPQGLNSVFDVDESTLAIIAEHAEKMAELRRAP